MKLWHIKIYCKFGVVRNLIRIVFCMIVVSVMASPKQGAEVLGHIKGKLIDETTQHPLIAANIIIEGTDIGCATDSTGAYLISNVRPGFYNLRCMMMGYKTCVINNVIVNPGRTTWNRVEIVPVVSEAVMAIEF